MQAISLDLGKDYEAVTVSFEPKDTPCGGQGQAGRLCRAVRATRGRGKLAFPDGRAQSINALTKGVGFHYAYDPAISQYAHAAAIMVLTPDGRMDRYFYGINYPARDLRLGLVDASQGKIGTSTDQALLYCYQYDPETGKYGMVVMNVVRAGGVLTLLVLGIFMFVMFRRETANIHVPAAAA